MSSRTRASASPLFVPRKSDRRMARATRNQFAAARDQARNAARLEGRKRPRPVSTPTCVPPTRPPGAPVPPPPEAADSNSPPIE